MLEETRWDNIYSESSLFYYLKYKSSHENDEQTNKYIDYLDYYKKNNNDMNKMKRLSFNFIENSHVEIRSHHSTIDPVEIINWIKLFSKIYSKVLSKTLNNSEKDNYFLPYPLNLIYHGNQFSFDPNYETYKKLFEIFKKEYLDDSRFSSPYIERIDYNFNYIKNKVDKVNEIVLSLQNIKGYDLPKSDFKTKSISTLHYNNILQLSDDISKKSNQTDKINLIKTRFISNDAKTNTNSHSTDEGEKLENIILEYLNKKNFIKLENNVSIFLVKYEEVINPLFRLNKITQENLNIFYNKISVNIKKEYESDAELLAEYQKIFNYFANKANPTNLDEHFFNDLISKMSELQTIKPFSLDIQQNGGFYDRNSFKLKYYKYKQKYINLKNKSI